MGDQRGETHMHINNIRGDAGRAWIRFVGLGAVVAALLLAAVAEGTGPAQATVPITWQPQPAQLVSFDEGFGTTAVATNPWACNGPAHFTHLAENLGNMYQLDLNGNIWISGRIFAGGGPCWVGYAMWGDGTAHPLDGSHCMTVQAFLWSNNAPLGNAVILCSIGDHLRLTAGTLPDGTAYYVEVWINRNSTGKPILWTQD
jgi:hypothetical protein